MWLLRDVIIFQKAAESSPGDEMHGFDKTRQIYSTTLTVRHYKAGYRVSTFKQNVSGYGIYLTVGMVIRVVKFSSQEYKIGKIFA